jgi:protocatechuate 3,4-dioxygenase beta subunit
LKKTPEDTKTESTKKDLRPPVAKGSGSAKTQDTVEVRVRVLDFAGKPVANARLCAPRHLDAPADGAEFAMQRLGTTDAEGRFRVKLPRKELGGNQPLPLVAVADGCGLDWVELPKDNPPDEVTLRLVKDQPIRGRVINTEGRPVAGVKVAIMGVSASDGLDTFLRTVSLDHRAANKALKRKLNLPLHQVLPITQSDKDGRFTITGIGAERLVGLAVKGEGIATGMFMVITRAGFDAEKFNQEARKGRPSPEEGVTLFNPSFEYVTDPTRPIEGTVREAGTGKPVAGVTLGIRGSTAVSDAKGRFRLGGQRKRETYQLQVEPPKGSLYLGRWLQVSDTPGFAPIKTDVELVRGVVIVGRVLDKATGKGVESQVRFSPLPDNKNAARMRDHSSVTFTDQDGNFRLVTMPGPGVLVAQVVGRFLKIDGVPVNPFKQAEIEPADRKRVALGSALDGYRTIALAGGSLEVLDHLNVCKVVDLEEGVASTTCDLFVDPGKTITANVQDAEGKPLPGAVVVGIAAFGKALLPLKAATCRIYALDPAQPRQVVFLHPERNLAATVTVRGDEKEPLTVRLGPTGAVTGRVVDSDRQPVVDAEVYPLYVTRPASELAKHLYRRNLLGPSLAAKTNKDGRFRLGGVVPGLKFNLGFVKGRQMLAPQPKLEVKPIDSGKTADLGEFGVVPRR